MRKKASSEYILGVDFKSSSKKSKSPFSTKTKLKAQPEQIALTCKIKSKQIKPKEEFYKIQTKAECNNSTVNCTQSRSKLTKYSKIKKSQSSHNKQESQLISQQGIMKLINVFATKIQRQWRVYLIRKRWKEIIKNAEIQREKQKSSKRSTPTVKECLKLEFDQKRLKRLSFLSSENNQEIVSSYNLEKYQTYPPVIQKKEYQQNNSDIQIQVQIKPDSIDNRRKSLDTYQIKSPNQNRRHSAGQVFKKSPACQSKALKIAKAFDITVVQKENRVKKWQEKSYRQGRDNIKYVQNEKNNISNKTSLNKMLGKCKKELQIRKFKTLLSVQTRYQRNQVNQKSYLQLVDRINEKHKIQLQQFRERQGQLLANWNDLIKLSKARQTRYGQDDHENSDISISIDRWDFNSSAKKSNDSHLQFSQMIQSSRALSFQSVLKQLQQQQKQQKKFRKIKSLQVIEAIAQRSKQISQKDVDSFTESPNQHEKNKLQPESIRIQEAVEQDRDDDRYMTPKNQKNIQEHNVSQLAHRKAQLQTQKIYSTVIQQIQLENQQEKKVTAQKKQSQNDDLTHEKLNQVQKYAQMTPNQTASSSQDKLIMKELFLKDFTPIPVNQSQIDPFVLRFIDLVEEKMILNNVKVINSVKFMFGKMSEYISKKKQKNQQVYQKIFSDIQSVNAWLLQISHFILDNYQQQLRQRLVNIKQPASIQLLEMAKKGLNHPLRYETIPEYMFKDFEFFYVENMAQKNQIPKQDYQNFSKLSYTFHRNLIDCLNVALEDEILCGKNWLQLPWKTQFFKCKKQVQEQSKRSLERSINLVSNWAQYSLGKILLQDDPSLQQNIQYEEQKILLVNRQQILEYPLKQSLSEATLLLGISSKIFEEQIILALKEIIF